MVHTYENTFVIMPRAYSFELISIIFMSIFGCFSSKSLNLRFSRYTHVIDCIRSVIDCICSYKSEIMPSTCKYIALKMTNVIDFHQFHPILNPDFKIVDF